MKKSGIMWPAPPRQIGRRGSQCRLDQGLPQIGAMFSFCLRGGGSLDGNAPFHRQATNADGGEEFGLRRFSQRRGESAARVQATVAMINVLQRLDHAICGSVDVSIEPLMVLEEIEAGSLIVWLKNILHRVDDRALLELDWKPIVGKYLVRAKYAYVNWANKGESERALNALAREFQQIASETDVKRFPDYAPPSTARLAEATKAVEQAKSYLVEGDKISYVVPDQPPADFDLAVQWTDEQLHNMLVKETVKGTTSP